MKNSHCPLLCKGLIALTPYSLIAFATINLFTYSPMSLFTQTNRLNAAGGADALVPNRGRSGKVPEVGVV